MSTFIGHPSELVNDVADPRSGRAGSRTESRVQMSAATSEEQSPISSSPQDDGLYHLCLIDSGKSKRRNPWAVFGSLTFELLVVAAVVLIPLFHTELLPKRQAVTMLYLQPPAVGAGSNSMQVRAPNVTSTHTPKSISVPRPELKTQEAPAPRVNTIGRIVDGVPGVVSGGVVGGVLSGVLDGTPTPVLAKAPSVPTKRIRVAARVVEANLIHDVAPQYPPEAGRERIEGTVVLLAVIGADGTVKDVQVQSGLPILAQAAIEAVKQWRYKPYMLNGEPVEVDSRITINFALSAS